MADAATLIKRENEKLEAFNKRLEEACDDGVTDAKLAVINDLPVVTLFGDVIEEEPEDEDEDADEGEDEDEAPPLRAKVIALSLIDAQAIASTEERIARVYEEANGSIINVDVAKGERKAYMLVTFVLPPDEAGEAETVAVIPQE